MAQETKYKRTKEDWLGHAQAFDAYANQAAERADWAILAGADTLADHLRNAAHHYRLAAQDIRDGVEALIKETGL